MTNDPTFRLERALQTVIPSTHPRDMIDELMGDLETRAPAERHALGTSAVWLAWSAFRACYPDHHAVPWVASLLRAGVSEGDRVHDRASGGANNLMSAALILASAHPDHISAETGFRVVVGSGNSYGLTAWARFHPEHWGRTWGEKTKDRFTAPARATSLDLREGMRLPSVQVASHAFHLAIAARMRELSERAARS